MGTYATEGELKIRILKSEREYELKIGTMGQLLVDETKRIYEQIEKEIGKQIADGVLSQSIPKILAIYVDEIYGQEGKHTRRRTKRPNV